MLIPVTLPREVEGKKLLDTIVATAESLFSGNARHFVQKRVHEGYFPGSVHRDFMSGDFEITLSCPVILRRRRWFLWGPSIRVITRPKYFSIKLDGSSLEAGRTYSVIRFVIKELDYDWIFDITTPRYAYLRSHFEEFLAYLYVAIGGTAPTVPVAS